MKRCTILLATACVLPLQSVQTRGQDQQTSNYAGLVGVWRGQLGNLPGVELVITNDTGELYGAILFYFRFRTDANAPLTSTPVCTSQC